MATTFKDMINNPNDLADIRKLLEDDDVLNYLANDSPAKLIDEFITKINDTISDQTLMRKERFMEEALAAKTAKKGGRRMRKRKRKGKSVKKRGKRVTKKHKRSKKNNKNKKKRSTRKMRKRRSMRR